MTAVDDLAEVAREHGAWFHIDGAYGLIAAASQVLRPAFAAVADADSVIADPHKWLATGVGCAATYVRDVGPLLRAFAQGAAAYLEGAFSSDEQDAVVQFDSIGIAYMDMGVELSAPSRGVLACAVPRELGRAGVAARVERHVGFARHVASGPVSTRAWTCCWTGNCQSPVSATQLTTRSTPKSSCGYAAPPGPHPPRRSSMAASRSGHASSTRAPSSPTSTRSSTTSSPSGTS